MNGPLKMGTLVSGLSGLMDHPVIDMTQVQGEYDIHLDAYTGGATIEDLPPPRLPDGTVLPGKCPVDLQSLAATWSGPGSEATAMEYIVVDSVMRSPTEK
ncbi:MAG: DUF3738 domain-containing protein [Ignavibacteriota bacterium]